MDLTRNALEYITEGRKANIQEINGLPYTDKRIDLVFTPQADCITSSTLSGFVSMVKAEKSKFAAPYLIHVESPENVSFYSAINEKERTREKPFTAHALIPGIAFNRYISTEEMIIRLKSQFVQNEGRDKLIKIFGNITENAVRQTNDDGFSQSVETRSGIALKSSTPVPSTISLIPYRTFSEIAQPESDFVVRIQKGPAGPSIALFEADGGAWKSNAMKSIETYLKESFKRIPDVNIVA